MKYSFLFTVLSFVCVNQIHAVPTKRDAGPTDGQILDFALTLEDAVHTKRDVGPTDVQILNFALTLEHLEAAFYKQGLDKHSQKDFEKAKYPSFARGRFGQIAGHEATHVEFLTGALQAAGAQTVEPCEYNFHDHDARSFVDTSAALENVGVSAYTGAAGFLSNKAYLAAAATILTVEARQAAWVNSAVRKHSAWGTAFDIPLGMDHAYTLAAGFIKACPPGNAALLPPVKAFPALSVPASARPGKRTRLTFALPAGARKQLYAAFLSGTGTVFVPIGEDMEVTVPEALMGFSYVVVTDDSTRVDGDVSVAGPAILMFEVNSAGKGV